MKIKAVEVQNKGCNWLINFAVVFIAVYLQEYIFRGNMGDTSRWVLFDFEMFLINYLLNYLFYNIALMLLGRREWAVLGYATMVILLSSINHYKLMYKGDVLLVSDYKMLKEAINILGHYKIDIYVPIIIALLIITAMVISLNQLVVYELSKKYRVILGILSVGMLIGCIGIIRQGNWLERGKVECVNEYLAINRYEKRGLLLGMIKEVPTPLKAPENYSRELVEMVIEQERRILNSDVQDSALPHIIMIMNETFYDIERFDELEFNQEIMPHLKKYQEMFSGGKLITPSYGGMTCQVEYEVLTGYPVSNSDGKIGYMELISREMDSLVSVFKSHGYVTHALHPYTKQYFKRNRVYEFMQFDSMTFIEDMEGLSYEGQYVSDKYVYQQLIRRFEARNQGEPFFAHIVTMQNHGGHSYIYDKHGVKELRQFGTNKNKSLETYANLLKESDESLAYLVEYFEAQNEPVIIVFYGDHAPNFAGLNWNPFANSNNIDEVLKQYTTPLLIWNNIGLTKQDYGYINAYKLGAEVLNMIGIYDDPYFNLVNASQGMSVNGVAIREEQGQVQPAENTEDYRAEMNKLWLLQYDRLFGKQYAKQMVD